MTIQAQVAMQAIQNFEQIKEYFSVAAPYEGFCACGDLAVSIKLGPYSGNPVHLCAEHSTLWTKQRIGLAVAA
jgi:hypothetical protein